MPESWLVHYDDNKFSEFRALSGMSDWEAGIIKTQVEQQFSAEADHHLSHVRVQADF